MVRIDWEIGKDEGKIHTPELKRIEGTRKKMRSNEDVAHLIDWIVLAVLNIHFSGGRT